MYRIVEENEEFVLIDKLPGFSVHKDQEDTGLTMQLKADRGYDELMPVHRLDKVTSGLMLFARNHAAASELSRAFSEHLVEKYYLALSDRKPKKKQGAIIGDMTRARRGAWRLAKTQIRPAVTQFFSASLKPGIRLFLLKPLTGKTHQIRVALKSIGAPIIGDPLYHEQTDSPTDRTYLHAYSLSFPFKGENYRFTRPPEVGELFDQDCRDLIAEEYAEPWALIWPRIQQHLPDGEDAGSRK
ncbi:TIGR01621 family pseudouridine synthase [Pontibacterium sp.]|uniref:TIGR01621 family pseudouridine synthase n=1 Tax=Pontibacterium sp. TaxID=2036026 RepID=UPI003515AD5A